MNYSNKTLLEDEIQRELGRLADLEVGTDEYKTTVDGITKLIDRATALDKMEFEQEEISNKNTREVSKSYDEKALREKELEHQRKDRLITHIIAIAGIVVPTVLTVWGTLKSLKFEETGTVTTSVGKGFINRLFPKK